MLIETFILIFNHESIKFCNATLNKILIKSAKQQQVNGSRLNVCCLVFDAGIFFPTVNVCLISQDKSKKPNHHWVSACYGSPQICDWCSKSLTNKPSLYCESESALDICCGSNKDLQICRYKVVTDVCQFVPQISKMGFQKCS